MKYSQALLVASIASAALVSAAPTPGKHHQHSAHRKSGVAKHTVPVDPPAANNVDSPAELAELEARNAAFPRPRPFAPTPEKPSHHFAHKHAEPGVNHIGTVVQPAADNVDSPALQSRDVPTASPFPSDPASAAAPQTEHGAPHHKKTHRKAHALPSTTLTPSTPPVDAISARDFEDDLFVRALEEELEARSLLRAVANKVTNKVQALKANLHAGSQSEREPFSSEEEQYRRALMGDPLPSQPASDPASATSPTPPVPAPQKEHRKAHRAEGKKYGKGGDRYSIPPEFRPSAPTRNSGRDFEDDLLVRAGDEELEARGFFSAIKQKVGGLLHGGSSRSPSESFSADQEQYRRALARDFTDEEALTARDELEDELALRDFYDGLDSRDFDEPSLQERDFDVDDELAMRDPNLEKPVYSRGFEEDLDARDFDVDDELAMRDPNLEELVYSRGFEEDLDARDFSDFDLNALD